MRPISDLTRRVEPFQVISDYVPAGDQPAAISELVARLMNNEQDIVLLGATGTGKSATTAWMIEQVQRPTLVIAPNKTLAAQLANEFKELLPNNAVEYFVSYYVYFRPESYVPRTDTYIEKESSIDEAIDRMRHSATRACCLSWPAHSASASHLATSQFRLALRAPCLMLAINQLTTRARLWLVSLMQPAHSCLSSAP